MVISMPISKAKLTYIKKLTKTHFFLLIDPGLCLRLYQKKY